MIFEALTLYGVYAVQRDIRRKVWPSATQQRSASSSVADKIISLANNEPNNWVKVRCCIMYRPTGMEIWTDNFMPFDLEVYCVSRSNDKKVKFALRDRFRVWFAIRKVMAAAKAKSDADTRAELMAQLP